jgi:hypothetical protein
LEDEAHLLCPEARALSVGHLADGVSGDEHFAGSDVVQSREAVQQRRLAAARGPHDGDHLAFTDSKVDALEGLDFDLAAVVGFADFPGLDHGWPRYVCSRLFFGGGLLQLEHVSS